MTTYTLEVILADHDLKSTWAGEYVKLSLGDRALIAADLIDAQDEDKCNVSEYRRRIGNGNLQSYADSLAAGSK